MEFVKVQGLGNDFVLLDQTRAQAPIPEARYGDLARRLCDRHFGIGADGVLLVLPSARADVRMRIFNRDGSEAEMCGNGIRCFARYVYESGLVRRDSMTVETLAGILVPRLQLDVRGRVTAVEVDMGVPVLERQQIPMRGSGRAVGVPIRVEERDFSVTAVSMGNPHCVLFVEDAAHFPVEYWGPRIERSDAFPRKTNVEFVQVLNDHEAVMRVWERGAAVTLACGTGSCAAAVACVLNGRTGREVLLHLDGGDLAVRWDAESDHLYMTGPAEEVFRGQIREGGLDG